MNPLLLAPYLGMANTVKDVIDPNVDLIPGVGFNEASRAAPQPQPQSSGGVYWVGSDGNRWVKDASGTRNVGSYTAGADNYWRNLGYSFVDDPVNGQRMQGMVDNPYMSGSSYTTSGGGSGSGSNTAADLAYLDDQQAQLERQRGYIGTAEQNGLSDILRSYAQTKANAEADNTRVMQDFDEKWNKTSTDKTKALDTVDTNARTLADSLRRRIGMASGSDSSAYQFAAPRAVARQATESRSGVMDNFGANFQAIDKARGRRKEDFAALLADLEDQRISRERDFKNDILSKRNAVDTSLSEVARQRALLRGGGYGQVRSAMAPYSDAIAAREGEINSLFDKYKQSFTPKKIATEAPQLRDYTVDRASIGAQQQANGDPYAYYDQFLKKKNEDFNY